MTWRRSDCTPRAAIWTCGALNSATTSDLEAATLFNPERFTLYLHNATINGSVRLDTGFTSDGEVRLSRTTIGGRLDLRGGTFTDRDGHAIEAEGLVSRGGIYLGWTEVAPSVNLTGAQTTTLADDPDTWPATFLIRGSGCGRSWTGCTASSATATDRAARAGRWRRSSCSCWCPAVRRRAGPLLQRVLLRDRHGRAAGVAGPASHLVPRHPQPGAAGSRSV